MEARSYVTVNRFFKISLVVSQQNMHTKQLISYFSSPPFHSFLFMNPPTVILNIQQKYKTKTPTSHLS